VIANQSQDEAHSGKGRRMHLPRIIEANHRRECRQGSACRRGCLEVPLHSSDSCQPSRLMLVGRQGIFLPIQPGLKTRRPSVISVAAGTAGPVPGGL